MKTLENFNISLPNIFKRKFSMENNLQIPEKNLQQHKKLILTERENYTKNNNFNISNNSFFTQRKKNSLFNFFFDKEEENQKNLNFFDENCSVDNLITLNKKISQFEVKNLENKENYQFFLSNLIMDLKKNHSGFFSNGPASRIQVKVLNNWLKTTLKVISYEITAKEKIKFVLIEDALNIALNEIIRQISFNCFERGNFLYKIFNFYFEYYEKLFKFEREEKNSQFGFIKEDILINMQNLEERINKRNQLLKDKNCKIDKLEKEISSLNKEMENNEKKIIESNEKVLFFKKFTNSFKNSFKKIKEENEHLVNKVNSLTKTLQKNYSINLNENEEEEEEEENKKNNKGKI